MVGLVGLAIAFDNSGFAQKVPILTDLLCKSQIMGVEIVKIDSSRNILSNENLSVFGLYVQNALFVQSLQDLDETYRGMTTIHSF